MHFSPPTLKKGDCIGIVSTARKISIEEVLPAKLMFESWGLQVVFGQNLFEINHQFAGSAEQRRADFQQMIDNTDIKAIVCARGGYGTVQIIDLLDFNKFSLNPKWIIGYSDITVLHSHLHQVLNCQSIHAIMPINFPKSLESNNSTESLRKALFGEVREYNFETSNLSKSGKVEGSLVGGNLSILYSLLGSNSSIDTNDKILFIEDLDEYLYHIHRMMMNLARNGKLSGIKALLVGGMSEMKDNTIPFGKSAEEIILEFFENTSIPIIFLFPAGHIQDNYALVFGRHAQLEVLDGKAKFIQN